MLVVIGVALIVFGGILVLLAKVWHDEYETGGHDPNHARPAAGDEKAWHREPSGEYLIRRGTHRLEGDSQEHTRRLMPTTQAARARVVLIGPEGIERDEEASRAHRTGETGRVRRAPAEGHVEEEGGADRERGQLPREAVADGEEGGADESRSRAEVASARWFRNAVTGEYIFLDEHGQRITFDEV